MRCLFLDIDGPVATVATYRAENEKADDCPYNLSALLDPACLERINVLLREFPDLQIVISSTWRLFHPLPELTAMLVSRGLMPGRIVGRTPENRDTYIRGHEIQAYLLEHAAPDTPIVIFDDDSDMEPLMRWLVVTPFDTGTQDEHIEQARNLLRG